MFEAICCYSNNMWSSWKRCNTHGKYRISSLTIPASGSVLVRYSQRPRSISCTASPPIHWLIHVVAHWYTHAQNHGYMRMPRTTATCACPQNRGRNAHAVINSIIYALHSPVFGACAVPLIDGLGDNNCHGLESDTCRFRHRVSDPTCRLCHSGPEDIEHFISHCPALSSARILPPLLAASSLESDPTGFAEYILGSRWINDPPLLIVSR